MDGEKFRKFHIKLAYLFVSYLISVNAELAHRRFEYKYSFKPPYLAQKNGLVPFWEYGGNAIASNDNVRVAPSLRSQKGAIWTKNPTTFDWWEVDLVFRVTGRGRIGADGLAFWYVQNKGAYDGDVFGSSDQWVGLGVFFDSFDNDNKHNNPYIMAIVNDGTKKFEHQLDGSTQQLAGCLRDFRNKPFPTRAKIEYYQNTLTVLFHNGMTSNDQDYEMCLRAENVFLPKNGYFGVSAATGGLADDHDVHHFLTTSLWPPGQEQLTDQMLSEEQKKLNQEYQDYQRKLDQQKEDYRKEHPDQKEKEPEVDDWFESDNQRELRQIFQGQSQMFDALRELNKKLDEIVGRQERTLSVVSMQYQGVAQQQQPPAAGAQQHQQPLPPLQQADSIISNQLQLMNLVREIRQYIGEVHTRTDTIISNQARQPTAQVQSVGYDMQSIVSEMRDGLNHVKQNFAQFQQRAGGAAGTPTPCPSVSCVSVTTLLVIAAVQLLILLGYSIYKDSKDSNAKKFY